MKYVKIGLTLLAVIAVLFYFFIYREPPKPQEAEEDISVTADMAVNSPDTEVVEDTTIAPAAIQKPANSPLAVQETLSETDIEAKEAKVKELQATMNSCAKNEDCIPVFPSCCNVAYPPYFIAKNKAPDFTKQYADIYQQGDCNKPVRCPRSFFGMEKAQCLDGKCVAAQMQPAPQAEEQTQGEQQPAAQAATQPATAETK